MDARSIEGVLVEGMEVESAAGAEVGAEGAAGDDAGAAATDAPECRLCMCTHEDPGTYLLACDTCHQHLCIQCIGQRATLPLSACLGNCPGATHPPPADAAPLPTWLALFQVVRRLLDGQVALTQDALRIDLVRTLWGAQVQEERKVENEDDNQPETEEEKDARVAAMLQRAVDLSYMRQCSNCHASSSLFDHNYRECMVLNCPCGHFICAYCGTTGRDTNRIHAHVKMMHPTIDMRAPIRIQHNYYVNPAQMGEYMLRRLMIWMIIASEAGYGERQVLHHDPILHDFESTVSTFAGRLMNCDNGGASSKLWSWCAPATLFAGDRRAIHPVVPDAEFAIAISRQSDQDMWVWLSYGGTCMTGATTHAAIAMLTRCNDVVRKAATTELDLVSAWSDDMVRESTRLLREELAAGRRETSQHLAYLMHQGLGSTGADRCGVEVWREVCLHQRPPPAAAQVHQPPPAVAQVHANGYDLAMRNLRTKLASTPSRTNELYWAQMGNLPKTGTSVTIPSAMYDWLLTTTTEQVAGWRQPAGGAGAAAIAGAGAPVPAAAAGAGAAAAAAPHLPAWMKEFLSTAEDADLQLALQLSLQDAGLMPPPPAAAAAAAAAPHPPAPLAPQLPLLPPLPQFPPTNIINRFTIPILRNLLRDGGLSPSMASKAALIERLVFGWVAEQYQLYGKRIQDFPLPPFDTWRQWPR